jgi:hypothetical protein
MVASHYRSSKPTEVLQNAYTEPDEPYITLEYGCKENRAAKKPGIVLRLPLDLREYPDSGTK